MNKTMCIVQLLIAWMMLEDEHVNGVLIVKPQNTKVWDDNVVRLDCCTDLDYPLVWQFTPVGSKTVSKEIFNGDNMLGGGSNYKVDTTKARCFPLIISPATKNLAGRYDCVDNDGFGEVASAELTILEKDIVCENENDCGVMVAVHGNNKPTSNFCQKKSPVVKAHVTFSCQICFAVSDVIEYSSFEVNCFNREFISNSSSSIPTPKLFLINGNTSGLQTSHRTTSHTAVVYRTMNSALVIGLSISLPLAIVATAIFTAVVLRRKPDIFRSCRSKKTPLLRDSQDPASVKLKGQPEEMQV